MLYLISNPLPHTRFFELDILNFYVNYLTLLLPVALVSLPVIRGLSPGVGLSLLSLRHIDGRSRPACCWASPSPIRSAGARWARAWAA